MNNINNQYFVNQLDIKCTDEFNGILTSDVFENTFITHLTFDYDYNQPTNQLPSSITHLTFGYCYNQPSTDLLSCITHLTFGCWYNQPLYVIYHHLLLI
jgi:hypothetical protein